MHSQMVIETQPTEFHTITGVFVSHLKPKSQKAKARSLNRIGGAVTQMKKNLNDLLAVSNDLTTNQQN